MGCNCPVEVEDVVEDESNHAYPHPKHDARTISTCFQFDAFGQRGQPFNFSFWLSVSSFLLCLTPILQLSLSLYIFLSLSFIQRYLSLYLSLHLLLPLILVVKEAQEKNLRLSFDKRSNVMRKH